MEYLKATDILRSLISETNSELLQNTEEIINKPNQMKVLKVDGESEKIVMESFTDEFVNSTLKKMNQTNSFVMTDIASIDKNGKEVFYLLYKGYHSKIEKGMVFYQIINKATLAPVGSLQFSNIEENIFYNVKTSDTEESACNAMETDQQPKEGKRIVFFIGHMDEQRLTYDIERLIFDTVHNVTKHPRLQFSFIIHIAHYGGAPSDELKERVNAIDLFTQKHFYPVYPNATFEFAYEQDGSISP